MPKQPKHVHVKAITSVDDVWAVEFADGVKLACAKVRDENHVDAIIGRGDDPQHVERMKAMITAVREKETQG